MKKKISAVSMFLLMAASATQVCAQSVPVDASNRGSASASQKPGADARRSVKETKAPVDQDNEIDPMVNQLLGGDDADDAQPVASATSSAAPAPVSVSVKTNTVPAPPAPVSSSPTVGRPGFTPVPTSEPRVPVRTPARAPVSATGKAAERIGGQAQASVRKLESDASDFVTPDLSLYQGDIDEMSRLQREIKRLELENRRVKLLTTLWDTVNEKERDTEILRQDRERERKAKETSQKDQKGATKGGAGLGDSTDAGQLFEMPAHRKDSVSPEEKEKKIRESIENQVRGSLPKVYAIYGASGAYHATILVPFYGEVTARTGDVLANGMVVKSVSSAGVVVVKDGNETMLTMGTNVQGVVSVPADRSGKSSEK